MDWIFEHIWLLIAIASVIARVLMKRNQADAAEGAKPPAKEYEFEDPELAERTRKIREEIQRKIAERRGQQTQSQALPPVQARPSPVERSPNTNQPPATLSEVVREVLQPRPEPMAPAARRIMAVNVAEESERQRTLMEKLKEAELMKASTLRRQAFEASTADKEPAALQESRAGVLEDLRNPQALRRAFILREVIGPPVGMR